MTYKELQKIKSYAEEIFNKSTDIQHGYSHGERVADNALKIASILEINNIDLNLLQAACYLHDLPQSMFKHGPALRHFFENYAILKYMPDILKELKITGNEYNILMNAIRHHTFSIPYRRLNRNGDVYLKIMQDADSIDFLNDNRESNFNDIKNEFIFYHFLSLYSKKYLSYARNNSEKYFNFPELSSYKWFKNQNEKN